MFRQAKLVLQVILATYPGLRRIHGWVWPLAVARGWGRSRRLMRQTQWAGREDEEARHVRALALLPALYLNARERAQGLDETELATALASSYVNAEYARLERETGLAQVTDQRQRWHVFFDRILVRGIGALNETECVSVDSDRFHARVHRCVLAELAAETDTVALARAVCAERAGLFARLLPNLAFSLAEGTTGTLARGASCCELMWQPLAPSSDRRLDSQPHSDPSFPSSTQQLERLACSESLAMGRTGHTRPS